MTGQELIDFIVKNNAQNYLVCLFDDRGALYLEQAELYCGDHSVPTPKLVHKFEQGLYIGLGNPADFEMENPPLPYEEPKQPEQCASQMSFIEIVDDMMTKMDEAGKKSWLETPECDLILGHHGVGQAIRNYYRLWEKGNPAVGDFHPDDVSFEIMKAVWAKVNAENPGYPKKAPFKMPEREVQWHSVARA